MPLPAGPYEGISASRVSELLEEIQESQRPREAVFETMQISVKGTPFEKLLNLRALTEEAVEARNCGWTVQEEFPQLTCLNLATKYEHSATQ